MDKFVLDFDDWTGFTRIFWGGEPLALIAREPNDIVATLFWASDNDEINSVDPFAELVEEGSVSNATDVRNLLAGMVAR